jgi:phosphoadenosine phosphosulfate reductase
MKACEIILLDHDTVMSKVSRPLARKLEHSVELLRKSEKMALRLDPENGFYLAFSGGKDSQCLYHVAKLAGVRFKAHMNLTSIDPPEVIRFVKTQYPDVELIKPRMSIYEMAKKKHILPTRTLRWCCAEFKETSGVGKVTLIGVRKEESARRAKREEISTEIKGKRNEETFDQWSEHEESMVACVGGKDKILVSPIIYWTERDVWEFLNMNGIPHCELYDEGYTRIGCICCPMSNARIKKEDAKRWPHVKRNWIKTIQWLIDNGYIDHNFNDAETGFRWWISDKSYKQFYADEFLQQKFEFKDDEK